MDGNHKDSFVDLAEILQGYLKKSATLIHSPGASLPPPKRSIGCVEMMSAATTVHGNPVMTIVANFRVAVPACYVTCERENRATLRKVSILLSFTPNKRDLATCPHG